MKSISFYLFFPLFLLCSCKTNNSITPYEYALLSAHVYDDGERELPKHFESYIKYEEKEKTFSNQLGGFLKSINVDKVKELSEKEEKGNLVGYLALKAVSIGGYHGQAYLNNKTGELVISHRGTENIMDALGDSESNNSKNNLMDLIRDLDNDYEIFSGQIPREQYLEARSFSRKVQQKYEADYGEAPKVIHTGHSLGAVLAELCALTEDCEAVTFESPGISPFLKELEELSAGSFDLESFQPGKAKITIYNAEPNKVNTLHDHIGKVVYLYDEKKAIRAVPSDDLLENIQLHSIDSLLVRFDQKTGKPIKR